MRTILCVDNHPAALQAVASLLRSRGYRCLTAETAETALDLLASESVDIALLDHWLSDTTGAELAIRIKQARNVPIIMLTGDPDLKEAPEAIELLLGKPQKPEDLLGFVAALIPEK